MMIHGHGGFAIIATGGHTILGGRKGLTVLDTRKDWRFENNPTAQSFGPMFYAGVPLMSPNMDGSKEAEKNAWQGCSRVKTLGLTK